MSYIDLPDRAAAYLKANGYSNVFLKRLDDMTGREGIIIRRVPSTVTARYMDTKRDVSYIYQIIVRSRSEKTAMSLAEELAGVLDLAEIPSGNSSYKFVAQEVYTLPQQLALEEAGYYAQEFRIKAYIEI